MERKKVKVFLDSNVILSGLFSDKGAPRIILDLLSLGLPLLSGVAGEFNIVEIERNLNKKMPEALPIYRQYLPLLHLEITPLPAPREIAELKGLVGEKDLPVLASAIRAKADLLVTGDRKDFAKVRRMRIDPPRVVTPAEFLDLILPVILLILEER